MISITLKNQYYYIRNCYYYISIKSQKQTVPMKWTNTKAIHIVEGKLTESTPVCCISLSLSHSLSNPSKVALRAVIDSRVVFFCVWASPSAACCLSSRILKINAATNASGAWINTSLFPGTFPGPGPCPYSSLPALFQLFHIIGLVFVVLFNGSLSKINVWL